MTLSPSRVIGDFVYLNQTNPLHMSGTGKFKPDKPKVVESFGDLLNNFISQVNQTQINAENLTQRFSIGDESVDIHQVSSAVSQAEMAITFTKSVFDRVINGYRELINLR